MTLAATEVDQYEALRRALQERALLASALAEIAYDHDRDTHAIKAMAVLREVFGEPNCGYV